MKDGEHRMGIIQVDWILWSVHLPALLWTSRAAGVEQFHCVGSVPSVLC